MNKNEWLKKNKDSFEKGKAAETVVKEYIKDIFNYNVEDVSENPRYQEKDIDFIVSNDEIVRYLEVKTDYKIAKTHNFFCEYDLYKNGIKYRGWMNKSKATDLFWVQFEEKKIYLLDFHKLREYCNEHKYKLRKYYNKKEDGWTEAIIMSIKDAREYKVLVHTIDLSSWLKERSDINEYFECA